MKFIKHFFKKSNSFIKDNVAVLAVGVALISLGFGIYNTYQIKNASFSVLSPGGVKTEKPEKLVKELPKDAPYLGNPKAKLTVVEFADFQCPFCGKFFNSVYPAIKSEYIDTDKIKFVYMDFAFLGPESKDAA